MYINRIPFYLIVKNGDSLSLNLAIDEYKRRGMSTTQFKGSNAAGHKLLNEIYEKPMEKFNDIFNLQENIKLISKENIFDSLLKCIYKYTEQFDILLKNNSIDNQFHLLATTTIKTSLLNEFLKPFVRKSSLVTYFTSKELLTLKKSIFTFCPPLTVDVCATPLGSFYISSYLENIQQQKEYSDSILKYSDVTIDFIPYLFITNKYIQENIWGSQLYGIKKLFPDEIGLQDFEIFNSYFPESIYSPFIKELFAKDTATKLSESPEIIFIDKNDSIKSFKELPRNILFVDLWASWCVPCKQEFIMNNKLDTFLINRGINKLYISIDDSLSKGKWVNNILRYNLKGSHVLASKTFLNYIKSSIYNEKENISIPRYILINRNGEVVYNDLPRPSEDHLYIILEKYTYQIEKKN